MITFLLCEQEVLHHPVLYLSHYFKQHRAAIARALGRAAGNGHLLLEHLFERPIVSMADVRYEPYVRLFSE